MTAHSERGDELLAEILADPNFEPELLRRSLAGDPFELAETHGANRRRGYPVCKKWCGVA